jgi:hypothetical protein
MDWTTVKTLAIGDPYDAEVEYLESDGSQYVVLGGSGAWDIDVQMTGTPTGGYIMASSTARLRFQANASGYYSANAQAFSISATTRVDANVNIGSRSISVTIAGVTKSASIAIASSPNIRLFGTATASTGASMRLYSIAKSDGTRTFKLVRVGNVGALYEVEAKTLIYPTVGTLAVGPDVRIANRQIVTKISTSDYPLVPGAKRVEYLQGDAVHNWIDPDITVTDDTEIELKMSFTPASTTTRFGGYTQWSEKVGSRIRTVSIGCNFAVIDTNPTGIQFGTTWTASDTWTIDTPHTLFIRISDTTDQSDPTPKTCLYVDGTKAVSQAVRYNASHLYKFGLCQNLSYIYDDIRASNSELDGLQPCRLYYCKIWQGGTLVRDFVPIKVGTEGCLYDKVTDTVYHSPGTVPFVCGAEVAETVLWKKPVPYDAEVEYLESDGTQYIDTGIYPADGLSFDLEAALMTNSSALTYSLFGGRNRMGGSDGQCSWWNIADFYFYGWGNNNDSGGRVTRNFTVGTQYAFHVDKTGITIDGTRQTTFTQQTAPTETDYPIYLFNSNNGGTLDTRVGDFRVYGFTIKNNGVTVRDFRPVRVGTTGYLFDRISWTLFGNAGTGDFGYGADVPS